MLEYYLYNFVLWFNYFIIFYTFAMTAVNMLQLALSVVGTASYMKKVRMANLERYHDSVNLVPISVLVPAYNEAEVVVHNVKSLLDINYATYEVVVINDGSKDDTLDKLIKAFDLSLVDQPVNMQLKTKQLKGVYRNPDLPRLCVIDKENGGKADALNMGINASSYPYFVSLDADSILDSDALTRIAMSFMEYKYTVAVGGIVRILNGSTIKNGRVEEIRLPKSGLATFQVVEYLRAFLVGRMWLTNFNALMIISGAFGAFKKDAVIGAGGYSETIGEDMELVLRLHRYMRKKKYKYSIAFMPDPVCWTQAPEKIGDLYKQRRRWHVGLRDSIGRNLEIFMNPSYGVLGMLAMPYYVFFELLGCAIEGIGLLVIPLSYFFGILSIDFFVLFIVLTVLYGILISLGALTLEEFTFNKYARLRDFFKLSLFSILENFGFRQMILFFRIVGLVFYKKYKKSWTSITRQKVGGDAGA